eukprot:3436510-Rhodomonas_salina.2
MTPSAYRYAIAVPGIANVTRGQLRNTSTGNCIGRLSPLWKSSSSSLFFRSNAAWHSSTRGVGTAHPVRAATTLKHEAEASNPLPATSTLYPLKLSPLNATPSTLSPDPSTLYPLPSTLHPPPSTLDRLLQKAGQYTGGTCWCFTLR